MTFPSQGMRQPVGGPSAALRPVRVVICDDSAVARRMIREALTGLPDIEIVAASTNGLEALEAVKRLDPDALVLDLEMPGASGFDVLKALREQRARVRTIVFSSVSDQGARRTVEAMLLGASDFVCKPRGNGPQALQDTVAQIRRDLAPRICSLGRREAAGSHGFAARPAPPPPVRTAGPVPQPIAGVDRRPATAMAPHLVVLGVSTGGPEALSKLLPSLGGPLAVPLVIVQHMPPIFTAHLAERLARDIGRPVTEAVDGQPLRPGTIVIAPGGKHLQVRASAGGQLSALITDEPPVNGCKPAVDILFNSAVRATGAATLAVVLTGMGRDGCEGARALKQVGARVLVQDEPSSVVWGMPGAVARAGLADGVHPLAELGRIIIGAIRSRQ